jgi:ribonuclease HI
MLKKKKYYAYFVPSERAHGVTASWGECEMKVSGKVGARFKAFDKESAAQAWLAQGAIYAVRTPPKLEHGIYFDAGTGRGEGVEISVTDEKGKDLLHKVLSREELNHFGKHRIENDTATNNYGELLALKYALLIAKKEKAKKIFGDSKLVIEYWSQWRMKRKELPAATVALASEVAELREAFEKKDGIVARINGAHNPADLGFHR